ncbi:LysM peptidoglycan-binding domain-containing protein [Demequina sp.]|uniref:LysM peptidoglycan-binding domain-containing protein n=1 Tax=Demequina sp. TaxID=2050685 RepID=UPI003A83D260
MRARPAPQRALRTAAITASAALAFTAFAGLPASADERHQVKPGETVSGLAVRYDTSVSSIVKANGLNSRALIVIGQTLTIPSSSSSQAASSSSGTHTVVEGDTVWDLARKYGTTVSTIVSTNKLGANATIRTGQRLSIPGATNGAKATATSNTVGSSSATHTVAAGDTVWDLARKYGVSVSSITSANSLGSKAIIREGQRLSIPGASGSGTTSASSGGGLSLATDDNLQEFGGTTQTYTVKGGDTLAAIANRFGVTTSSIVSANGIKNASLIRIGQSLTIPGGVPTGLVGDTFAGRTYSDAVVGAANQNKATLNAMDVPTRAQIQSMIVAKAKELGVDPALAQAIAYQESGFNMRAVSPANAIGAMQVIPSTGEWVSDLAGRELNLLVPEDNITAGVTLLRHLTRGGRDLETAIAGYYQGEAGVAKYGMHADTRQYVASVLALMNRF